MYNVVDIDRRLLVSTISHVAVIVSMVILYI